MSSELQKRLDLEKQARESEVPFKPTPPIDFTSTLPVDYQMRLVWVVLAHKLGVTIAEAEEIYGRQRAAQQRRETDERIAATKAEAENEKLRLESNKKVLEKVLPYLRIAPLDFERRFKIDDDGSVHAVGDGVCTCGYDYRINLVFVVDALMASENKGLWFRRRHLCRTRRTDGSTDERTKAEPAFGIFLDQSAMTTAAIGRTRWSSGPPEQFKIERPVI